MFVSPMKEDPASGVGCSPSLFHLFASFLRMGVTAFGGPAMIAYIRSRVVSEKKWLDPEAFKDGVALCQTIPGATVMQMAAYIGLRLRGVWGAICAFIGFGLPAFLLMSALSMAYAHTHALPVVSSVLNGLQVVVVAVMANAALTFGKTSLTHWKDAALAAVAAGLFGLTANPFIIVSLSALLGLLFIRGAAVPRGAANPGRIESPTLPFLSLLILFISGMALLLAVDGELFQMALLMSKVDLLAFGGAFGSVPLMFHEVVEVRSWMDAPTFLNGIALGQFTPGPIVITATFVGYLLYGIPGALVATLAVFSPSFILLIGTAPWFDRLRSSPMFTRAIRGILCSFVGLLFTVTIRFAMNIEWGWLQALLAAGAFTALVWKVDLLWVIVAGVAISAAVL
jgi:chromate transporter